MSPLVWEKSAQLCKTCQRSAVSVKIYYSGSVEISENKLKNYVYAQLQLKKKFKLYI